MTPDEREKKKLTIDVSKEWCERMAQTEADAEIGAGLLAIDPTFDGEAPLDADILASIPEKNDDR